MEKSKEKEYLYHLLSDALMNIRARAYESNNKEVFWIADFFHNLPTALLYEENSYSDILGKLKDRANHDNMGIWLDDRIEDVNRLMMLKNNTKT